MSAQAILSQVTGDSARARKGDPETSHAAADSNSAEGLEASELEVLTILELFDRPVTDDAIAFEHERRCWRDLPVMQWEASRLRTARKQLAELGRVVQDGEGKTRKGRKAAAWRLAVAS